MGATYSKAKDYCKLPRTMGVMDELYEKVAELRDNKDFVTAGYQMFTERNNEMVRRAEASEMVNTNSPLRAYQQEDVAILKDLECAAEPYCCSSFTPVDLVQ